MWVESKLVRWVEMTELVTKLTKMTIDQLGKELGLSEKTIRRMAPEGLPRTKEGKRWEYDLARCREWMAKRDPITRMAIGIDRGPKPDVQTVVVMQGGEVVDEVIVPKVDRMNTLVVEAMKVPASERERQAPLKEVLLWDPFE